MSKACRRLRLRGGPFAALAVAALVLAPAPSSAEDDFKTHRKRYEAYLERPSLFMRQRGRERFAATRDPRALAILMKSYGRLEAPRDQNQYLLASTCAIYFREAEHLPAFVAWRKRNARPRDAWLWFRSLDLEHELGGADALLAVARSRKPAVLRAAAIEVLAGRGDDAVLPLVTELAADLPSTGAAFDRARLLEAAASALYERRKVHRGDAWKAAAEALLAHLDAKATADRTRLVIARRLARIYGADALYSSGAAWRALMRGEAPPPEARARLAPPKRPRFLGIEGTGSRIVYVIDMSDSMLTPLTGEEIEDLKKRPRPVLRPRQPKPVVTGGAKGGRPRPPRPPPAVREEDPEAAGLDWDRIRTRFDAAREFLKLSLAGLDPQQSFCVIGFGSDATLLKATPGLLRASPDNVLKAIGELDAIVPGPKKKGRPYGTLRGYTNMHGGLHRAFKIAGRGLVKQHEYVDPATFEHGADTIYLLSDGHPTWDDWPALDTLEKEDDSGDPELGGRVDQKELGHFYGPYANITRLRVDVHRLNIFRKVEIHSIGLGEYDPGLLQWIAKLGVGRFRRIPEAR